MTGRAGAAQPPKESAPLPLVSQLVQCSAVVLWWRKLVRLNDPFVGQAVATTPLMTLAPNITGGSVARRGLGGTRKEAREDVEERKDPGTESVAFEIGRHNMLSCA